MYTVTSDLFKNNLKLILKLARGEGIVKCSIRE